MTDPEEPKLRISPKTIMIGVAVLIVYLLLKPTLEDRFGWELPDIIEKPHVAQNDQPSNTTPSGPQGSDQTPQEELIDPKLAISQKTNPNSNSPVLGVLKELRGNVYQSTAGLRYGPGSADKHRLTHVMQHAQDDPDKPVHGVFNADQKEILALLDEAWEMTQERGPPLVHKEKDQDRTVYTIDVGKTIGYVGGQSGKRKNYPKCHKIKLVVEGADVITAYPTQ